MNESNKVILTKMLEGYYLSIALKEEVVNLVAKITDEDKASVLCRIENRIRELSEQLDNSIAHSNT